MAHWREGDAVKTKANSSTSQSLGASGTNATVTFAANELQVGDCIEIHSLWNITGAAGSSDYIRIGFDDLTDAQAIGRPTITSQLSHARLDRVWIRSTTESISGRFNLATGLGSSAADLDTQTINTATGVDLLFGCTIVAATTIVLEAYVVKIIKAL